MTVFYVFWKRLASVFNHINATATIAVTTARVRIPSNVRIIILRFAELPNCGYGVVKTARVPTRRGDRRSARTREYNNYTAVVRIVIIADKSSGHWFRQNSRARVIIDTLYNNNNIAARVGGEPKIDTENRRFRTAVAAQVAVSRERRFFGSRENHYTVLTPVSGLPRRGRYWVRFFIPLGRNHIFFSSICTKRAAARKVAAPVASPKPRRERLKSKFSRPNVLSYASHLISPVRVSITCKSIVFWLKIIDVRN